MKKITLILAMFLIAATTFGQTERRPSNKERSAQPNPSNRTETKKEETSTRQKSSDADNKARVERSERNTERDKSTNSPSSIERNRETTPNRQRQVDQDKQRTPAQRDIKENKPERNTTQQRDDRHRTDVDRTREPERSNTRPVNHAAHTVPHRDYSSSRVYRDRHEVQHYYHRPPQSRSYRSVHYVYRRPVDVRVVWTPVMYRRYVEIYPMIKVWYYPQGYRIETISAYDAMFYRGEVMNVYGRVNEVFYSHATDEYFLYFGPYYPYQDFTVVIPGYLARSYNPQPMRFFENQYIVTTGLITSFEEIPEIVVKDQIQVQLY